MIGFCNTMEDVEELGNVRNTTSFIMVLLLGGRQRNDRTLDA